MLREHLAVPDDDPFADLLGTLDRVTGRAPDGRSPPPATIRPVAETCDDAAATLPVLDLAAFMTSPALQRQSSMPA